jgi:geranylgeranyl pyrophosphate synthase
LIEVLDFTSSEEALVKAAGADLLGGKGDRCPLILFAGEVEPEWRQVIQTVLREGTYSTVRQQDLLDAIMRTGALDQARARANEYAEDARSRSISYRIRLLRLSTRPSDLHSRPRSISF